MGTFSWHFPNLFFHSRGIFKKMEVVSIHSVNTLNFLELQETIPSPLERIKTVGFCPSLYLENLDCILSFLWSFGQKLWKLPREASKEFQSPLPVLCLLEIWIHWTMSTMSSDQIVPGFIPTSKVLLPKPLWAAYSTIWHFSGAKSFHFWLYFKSINLSWYKLCPLFLNLHLVPGSGHVLHFLDLWHKIFFFFPI